MAKAQLRGQSPCSHGLEAIAVGHRTAPAKAGSGAVGRAQVSAYGPPAWAEVVYPFGLIPPLFQDPDAESAQPPRVVTLHGVSGAEPIFVPSQLSKRAARRIIQRAFVLAGRDRNVRQHIRQADVTSLWIIEDWQLTWTLLVHHGRLEFDRRPARTPDLTFTWRTAEDFFREARTGARGQTAAEVTGNLSLERFTDPVRQAFRAALDELLSNPVDEGGDPLV